MPYIIDGHNLIGQIEDIDLAELDDEARLITRLQAFAQRSGKRVLVYFDHGQAGGESPRNFGSVRVFFVPRPRSADDAIEAKLQELGGEARNWTLVSSDRRLRDSANHAGARVIRSEEFARVLASTEPANDEDSYDEEIDVAYWENLFNEGRDQPDKDDR